MDNAQHSTWRDIESRRRERQQKKDNLESLIRTIADNVGRDPDRLSDSERQLALSGLLSGIQHACGVIALHGPIFGPFKPSRSGFVERLEQEAHNIGTRFVDGRREAGFRDEPDTP